MIKNCKQLLSLYLSRIKETQFSYFHSSADILKTLRPSLSLCVHESMHIFKNQIEVRVQVCSRPLRTSGSCYSCCDLCVVRLQPSPHCSSVGALGNDSSLLQFPGPPAVWVFAPLLWAGGGGLLLTSLLLFSFFIFKGMFFKEKE